MHLFQVRSRILDHRTQPNLPHYPRKYKIPTSCTSERCSVYLMWCASVSQKLRFTDPISVDPGVNINGGYHHSPSCAPVTADVALSVMRDVLRKQTAAILKLYKLNDCRRSYDVIFIYTMAALASQIHFWFPVWPCLTYRHTEFRSDTSVFWKPVAVILIFYFRFRSWPFHWRRHVVFYPSTK